MARFNAMNYAKPTCLSLSLSFIEQDMSKTSFTRFYFLCTLCRFYANAKRTYVNYMKGRSMSFAGYHFNLIKSSKMYCVIRAVHTGVVVQAKCFAVFKATANLS